MPDQDFQFRKIIVATDFSRQADAALRQAVNLADQTKAEITVTHVITDVAWAVEGTSYQAHWKIPPAEIKKAFQSLRGQAEKRLAEAIAPHLSPERTLQTQTLAGVPFVEIIREVQKKGYDLVIAGTRGLAGIKRFMVGSTAERLVRKCPCPVWIEKPGRRGPPRTILVPVDFSEVSGKSLRLAAFMAKLFNGSLRAIHVLDNSPTEGRIPDSSGRWEITRTAAAKRLTEFVRAHVPPTISVKKMIVVGPASQRIEVAARRFNIDLIVMGSVGRTGIPGFFIGNTAEKILRCCNRSILAVKPDRFVSPVQPES